MVAVAVVVTVDYHLERASHKASLLLSFHLKRVWNRLEISYQIVRR